MCTLSSLLRIEFDGDVVEQPGERADGRGTVGAVWRPSLWSMYHRAKSY